jgi:hypothetical protein
VLRDEQKRVLTRHLDWRELARGAVVPQRVKLSWRRRDDFSDSLLQVVGKARELLAVAELAKATEDDVPPPTNAHVA